MRSNGFLEGGEVSQGPEITNSQIQATSNDLSNLALLSKSNIGSDVQEKIHYVDSLAIQSGLDLEQRKLLLGLIDHESAGTWSETIVGDNGCSIGIAQWNNCVGNIAPNIFEEQAQKIVNEMVDKFSQNSNLWAVSKHNAPYGSYRTTYVNKVIESSKLFN